MRNHALFVANKGTIIWCFRLMVERNDEMFITGVTAVNYRPAQRSERHLLDAFCRCQVLLPNMLKYN